MPTTNKKFPFKIVCAQAFELLDAAALAISSEVSDFYYDTFVSYLTYSGWTESEFDLELIKYIDNNWVLKNQNAN